MAPGGLKILCGSSSQGRVLDDGAVAQIKMKIMSLWLFILGALIVQEGVSTGAALMTALHYQFSIWLIHATFVAASLLDIFAGYGIGALLHPRVKNTRVGAYTQKKAALARAAMGKGGERTVLFLAGLLNPAHIDAFVFAILRIPLVDVVIFVFLGNVCWYAAMWMLVSGVTTVAPNLMTGISIVAVIILSVFVAIRRLVMTRFRE
jgi:membrane protein YqaA with SNARE-associated domain